MTHRHCCSCNSTFDVRDVTFWISSRSIFVDRELCPDCRPEPGALVDFGDWLDWAWENRRQGQLHLFDPWVQP
jgi:hypothetical protein